MQNCLSDGLLMHTMLASKLFFSNVRGQEAIEWMIYFAHIQPSCSELHSELFNTHLNLASNNFELNLCCFSYFYIGCLY